MTTSREPTGQAISDGGWMDAAIEAAAAAYYDEIDSHASMPGPIGFAVADDVVRGMYRAIAEAHILAALPHIRSAIADEIEAAATPVPESWRGLVGDAIQRDAWLAAARVARGGPLDA